MKTDCCRWIVCSTNLPLESTHTSPRVHLSGSRAGLHAGHVVGVTLGLQPLLPVPVRPVRAAGERAAPAALQLVRRVLEAFVGGLIVTIVGARGQAAVAVGVGVAGRQGLEQDGGLVRDGLVLHAQPMVLVNSFTPGN